jgi:hypothetical protein
MRWGMSLISLVLLIRLVLGSRHSLLYRFTMRMSGRLGKLLRGPWLLPVQKRDELVPELRVTLPSSRFDVEPTAAVL